MPWKETKVYEERMKFLVAFKNGGWSMTDLCREFGISRVTGYKYLRQYEEQGLDGLKDQSKAPKNHPHAIGENVTRRILECRQEHPTWGPRKILASVKCKYHRAKEWPCPATIGRILKRNGMIKKRKRIRKAVQIFPLSHVKNPNDVWCTDFKGHFTVGDGKRCDPLTISDAHSRFLLGCDILQKTDTLHTIQVFSNVFREYGMPNAIRTDNGTPFAARGIAGLSRLSVWWLKLGIHLERIEPGKPQQNGRHERIHRTLKQCTALPARSSLEAQQKAFDDFRREYNFERPHEALGNKFPSDLYEKSNRPFPEKLKEVEYPTNMDIHIVSEMGDIRYEVHRVFISGALTGEPIALEEIDDRHHRIHFCSTIIGILDRYTGKILQYKNPVPIENKIESN